MEMLAYNFKTVVTSGEKEVNSTSLQNLPTSGELLGWCLSLINLKILLNVTNVDICTIQVIY